MSEPNHHYTSDEYENAAASLVSKDQWPAEAMLLQAASTLRKLVMLHGYFSAMHEQHEHVRVRHVLERINQLFPPAAPQEDRR